MDGWMEEEVQFRTQSHPFWLLFSSSSLLTPWGPRLLRSPPRERRCRCRRLWHCREVNDNIHRSIDASWRSSIQPARLDPCPGSQQHGPVKSCRICTLFHLPSALWHGEQQPDRKNTSNIQCTFQNSKVQKHSIDVNECRIKNTFGQRQIISVGEVIADKNNSLTDVCSSINYYRSASLYFGF